eukprot:COSAG06_NODE_2426_length_6899_cov_7.350147_11_plen_59_part_00
MTYYAQEVDKNYAGDISTLHALGFSAAKFDNCTYVKTVVLSRLYINAMCFTKTGSGHT